MNKKFSTMKISEKTIKALKNMGFENPTEVQQKTVPEILNEKEIVVRSKTGSGKTAAFGIGLVELIAESKGKHGLVIAPTRELAIQITKELRDIGKGHRTRVYTIYGGQSIERQVAVIRKGFDIIVATPGRLLDHVRKETIRLDRVEYVVLDEADRMLDMGFIDDINTILEKTSDKKKMFLFSATIDDRIKVIAQKYMHSPEIFEIGTEEVHEIEEETITLKRREKISTLRKILNKNEGKKVIIFVATKRSVEYVCDKLNQLNINAKYLHGEKTQNQREKAVREFKKGYFSVLVATDVVARGIHIDDVELIINFDRAESADTHKHRVGRTGRMGKTGKAITFEEVDPYVPKNRRNENYSDYKDKKKRKMRKTYFYID